MFRDPTLAAKEKEIARLREELEAAKADDAELLTKVRKAEEELRKERAKKNEKKFSWPSFRRRPKTRGHDWSSFDRSFGRAWIMHKVFMGIVCALILGVMGMSIYHYATDIQEGVITSKAYHPPETTCTTTDGRTTCTTHPEHWSVDIAYEGRTATWSVSESEYNKLQRGEWYCFQDMFHSASDCQGEPE